MAARERSPSRLARLGRFLSSQAGEAAMSLIERITDSVIARGDLGHLALLVWGGMASLFCGLVLRDLAAANKRFDDFVRELARFNRRHAEDDR